MKFDLDHIYIEDACRDIRVARRVIARAASLAPITFVADGRECRAAAAPMPPIRSPPASAGWSSCVGAVLF